jgi:endonuclease/exonuclease/phosphatase family metal-dependent hydrolase
MAGALCLTAGCDPFHVDFADVEPATTYQAQRLGPVPELPQQLRVMTWNIKFGGGRIDFFFDCFGDRVLMQSAEVISNLEGLARKIRQVDPDILLLQEVDVRAKRSAFIDQVQWLLDHTALDYGAYASQWRADFVPSDGLGAMDDGNAILSRWPLRDATRIALPQRDDQDALTAYFYLRRNILTAKLDAPSGPSSPSVGIVATHSEAYSRDGTKLKHIQRFHTEIARMAESTDLVIAGGDLNTIPPGSTKTKDFPDSVCTDEDFVADDFTAEADWLDPLYADFSSAIPLADYQADNAAYFSHTVDSKGFWNRTLDYLFTNKAWDTGSGLVHQSAAEGGIETMPLSDHAPLSATVTLP